MKQYQDNNKEMYMDVLEARAYSKTKVQENSFIILHLTIIYLKLRHDILDMTGQFSAWFDKCS